MREQINPSDAYRLAQAWQMIDCYKRGVEPARDRNGRVRPSEEAFAYVGEHYEITDEIPPKHGARPRP